MSIAALWYGLAHTPLLSTPGAWERINPFDHTEKHQRSRRDS
jgi:hypothetical protein